MFTGPYSSGQPNSGHGHVYSRPDGVRARCGGPAMCRQCAADRARREVDDRARREAEAAAEAGGLEAPKELFQTSAVPHPDPYGWDAAIAEVKAMEERGSQSILGLIEEGEARVARLKLLYLRTRKWRKFYDTSPGAPPDLWRRDLGTNNVLILRFEEAFNYQMSLDRIGLD